MAVFDELRRGGDVAALLGAAGDPQRTIARRRARPADALRRGLEHRAQPLVLQVPAPILDRVDAERAGDLVEVRLAREVVRGGGEAAIRALAQRRTARMELDVLVGRLVRAANPRTAGVPVVELPGDQPPVGIDRASHLDEAGGAEVGVRELLRARPYELDRPLRGPGEPRGFDRMLAAVLAAVGRARVGHDHPHAIFGDGEGGRQLGAHAEWPLRAGPDRELAVDPLGDGRARLERHVRDVRNPERRLERARRRRARLRHVADDLR